MPTASARISNVKERQLIERKMTTKNTKQNAKYTSRIEKDGLNPEEQLCFLCSALCFCSETGFPVRTMVKSASCQQAAALRINRWLTRAVLLGYLLTHGTPFKAKLIGAALAPP